MSSAAFVISTAHGTDSAEALRQAVEGAGVKPSQIQDAILTLDNLHSHANLTTIVRSAELTCPTVSVLSALRAICFAAESILSGDVELVIVMGVEAGGYTTLVLASPEAVGRWNLFPRARLAARSLEGVESALRRSGIVQGDVTITREADSLKLVADVLDELEKTATQWGMVTAGSVVLVIERM